MADETAGNFHVIVLKREIRKTEDVVYNVPQRYVGDDTLLGKIVDVLLDAEPTNQHGDSWRDRVMLANDVDEMDRALALMRKAYEQGAKILSVVEEHGKRPLVKYGLREGDTCFTIVMENNDGCKRFLWYHPQGVYSTLDKCSSQVLMRQSPPDVTPWTSVEQAEEALHSRPQWRGFKMETARPMQIIVGASK